MLFAMILSSALAQEPPPPVEAPAPVEVPAPAEVPAVPQQVSAPPALEISPPQLPVPSADPLSGIAQALSYVAMLVIGALVAKFGPLLFPAKKTPS